MHPHDIDVIHPGKKPRLAGKPSPLRLLARRQDLDRDPPLQVPVRSRYHEPERTLAQLLA